MRSSNPVFARSEQFAPRQPTSQGYPQQGYGYPQQPSGDPYGQQPYGVPQPQQPAGGVMTIDDVITKSAITLGVVFLVAALSFMFLPAVLPSMMSLGVVTMVAGLITFGVVLMMSFRRQIGAPFAMLFSVVEGVFVGAFSLLFEILYPGIVVPAVLATFVAAAATLAAYKGLRIKVTSQFRKIVTISTFAFAGLVLLNLGLSFAGIDLGIRNIGSGAGWLAVAISIVALVLAVASLIMDFDYIEQGIRNRLPASESWRAAFGLTVTMVWLYTEILRVMSYFRN